jgi:hypothetical protein
MKMKRDLLAGERSAQLKLEQEKTNAELARTKQQLEEANRLVNESKAQPVIEQDVQKDNKKRKKKKS